MDRCLYPLLNVYVDLNLRNSSKTTNCYKLGNGRPWDFLTDQDDLFRFNDLRYEPFEARVTNFEVVAGSYDYDVDSPRSIQ